MQRVEDVESAEAKLRREAFDIVLVDQRIPREGHLELDGGSSLVERLKAGEYGSLNRHTPFLFITGSRAWIDEHAVRKLDGYLGIALKGGDLTPRLLTMLESTPSRADHGTPIETVVDRLFAAQIDQLGLSEKQIADQDLEDLALSLARVNEAMAKPESFGVAELRLTDDGSVAGLDAAHDAQLTYGILPVLLASKRAIVSRIREVGGADAINSLEQVARASNSSSGEVQQVREAIDRIKISLAAGDEERRIDRDVVRKRALVEITRARADIWRSFLARESMASLIGGTLLVLFGITIVVATFTRTDLPVAVTNAFLLMLGYFFGQSAARSSPDDRET